MAVPAFCGTSAPSLYSRGRMMASWVDISRSWLTLGVCSLVAHSPLTRDSLLPTLFVVLKVAAHGYIAEFFRDIVKRMPSKRQLRKHREEFKRDKIIGTDGDNEEPHSKQEEQVLSPMEQASRQHLPPRILMHSYAGSRDSMLQLLRLPNLGPRLYFSFSQFVHARMKREHALDIIRTCPRERLLIESDMHRVADVGRAMAEVLLFVSEAREWTLEETAHVTWENACRFYEVSG